MKTPTLQEKYYHFQRCVIRLGAGLTRDLTDEIYLAGIVKHYEMAFELGWKVMRDYMLLKGIPEKISFTKDVIKAAFTHELGINPQIWLDMIEFRNKMVHEYGEEAAHILIEKLKAGFLSELQSTAVVMKELLDELE